jgi:hypothetical protein
MAYVNRVLKKYLNMRERGEMREGSENSVLSMKNFATSKSSLTRFL